MMAYQNAFSLPPSSVLLLLHRSRYCYSRASPKHESLYRVKEQRTTNTLIQKVEFDRDKRRYELFRTGSETKRTMATSDGSDTIDSDDE
jgi:hypothetical protein